MVMEINGKMAWIFHGDILLKPFLMGQALGCSIRFKQVAKYLFYFMKVSFYFMIIYFRCLNIFYDTQP